MCLLGGILLASVSLSDRIFSEKTLKTTKKAKTNSAGPDLTRVFIDCYSEKRTGNSRPDN